MAKGFYVEHRGTSFRCQVRYKGKNLVDKFVTAELADIWGKARVLEIDQGIVFNKEAKLVGTLGDLIKEYCRVYKPRRKWSASKDDKLDRLVRDLGKLQLAEINEQVIKDYALALGDAKTSSTGKSMGGSGIRSLLYYLKEVLDVGRKLLKADTKYVLAEVMTAMKDLGEEKITKKSNKRTRRVTQAEIDAIKASVSTHSLASVDLAAIIDVLSVFPIRLGELCKIEWTDIDHQNKTVLLRTRKHPDSEVKQTNNETVILPRDLFGIDVYKLIADRPAHLSRPFPYGAIDSKGDVDTTLVSNTFYNARARAVRICPTVVGRTHAETVHLHDLRARGISMMIANNVPLPLIASISGHKDWKVMAEHYTRLDPAEIHAAITSITGRKSSGKLELVELPLAA